MTMDVRKIKKLIEMVQESGIAELSITEGEQSIRIISQGKDHTGIAVKPAPAGTQAKQPIAKIETPVIVGFVQTSPMVGTFYGKTSLGNSPKLGQHVVKGEVICTIEAMRMQNPIEADRDGIIGAFWVKDGDEVVFDQPLFTLI
ncbi:acetyl-CoA carboxylase biotin carboxyl carrier protein [Shewanella sp. A25]|nr:acetyl-CoA carboxylase biotin carboxyl carrier protein [Shewanella shenzhenensis]